MLLVKKILLSFILIQAERILLLLETLQFLVQLVTMVHIIPLRVYRVEPFLTVMA